MNWVAKNIVQVSNIDCKYLFGFLDNQVFDITTFRKVLKQFDFVDCCEIMKLIKDTPLQNFTVDGWPPSTSRASEHYGNYCKQTADLISYKV